MGEAGYFETLVSFLFSLYFVSIVSKAAEFVAIKEMGS